MRWHGRFFRCAAICATAVWLAGCGSLGLAQGSHDPNCTGSGRNDTIGDPGDFDLYVQGGADRGTVRDYSGDPNGVAETNTCAGIASVSFSYQRASSTGVVTVSPLGVGTCSMRFFNSSGCVSDTIVVHPGADPAAEARRAR